MVSYGFMVYCSCIWCRCRLYSQYSPFIFCSEYLKRPWVDCTGGSFSRQKKDCRCYNCSLHFQSGRVFGRQYSEPIPWNPLFFSYIASVFHCITVNISGTAKKGTFKIINFILYILRLHQDQNLSLHDFAITRRTLFVLSVQGK